MSVPTIEAPVITRTTSPVPAQLYELTLQFANADQPGRVSALLGSLDGDGHKRRDILNLRASCQDQPEITDFASGDVLTPALLDADDMLNTILDSVIPDNEASQRLSAKMGFSIAGQTVRMVGIPTLFTLGSVNPEA